MIWYRFRISQKKAKETILPPFSVLTKIRNVVSITVSVSGNTTLFNDADI